MRRGSELAQGVRRPGPAVVLPRSEAVSRLALGQPASVEVSQAKALANEKCLMAVRMAQQIHGGIGFVAEALLDRPGPVRLGCELSLDEEGSEVAARQHA